MSCNNPGIALSSCGLTNLKVVILFIHNILWDISFLLDTIISSSLIKIKTNTSKLLSIDETKCGPDLDTLFGVEVFVEFYAYAPMAHP